MDSQPAFSRHVAECVAFKLGCDNVAGSELERDLCGQCTKVKRLRNRCVGCDGRAYSNMRKGDASVLSRYYNNKYTLNCWIKCLNFKA